MLNRIFLVSVLLLLQYCNVFNKSDNDSNTKNFALVALLASRTTAGTVCTGLNSDGSEYTGTGCTASTLYSSFSAIPSYISYTKGTAQLYSTNGHYYRAVKTPAGGINWVQAKKLAESVGGYLATVTSRAEMNFIYDLVKNDSGYWFTWGSTHDYNTSGPFLGGYQPYTETSATTGWKWVSGETFDTTSFNFWYQDGYAYDLTTKPDNQPNDATGGNQNVTALGEAPNQYTTYATQNGYTVTAGSQGDYSSFSGGGVPFAGDFPHTIGSYGADTSTNGSCYGFIIEYDSAPTDN